MIMYLASPFLNDCMHKHLLLEIKIKVNTKYLVLHRANVFPDLSVNVDALLAINSSVYTKDKWHVEEFDNFFSQYQQTGLFVLGT